MKRGEIWLADFHPAVGQEMRKQRRAVIINDDNVGVLQLRVVVPFTEWGIKKLPYPWMVRLSPNKLNGLTKDVIADTFQIKSISTKRLIKRLGYLNPSDMDKIVETLGKTLGVNYTACGPSF